MHVIGIHLGLTSSSVAVLRNDEVKIILNEEGRKKTSSYVAFVDGECIIGSRAKTYHLFENPKNTVYGMERLIGRRFTDSSVTFARKNCTFDVVSDGDIPMILVKFKNEWTMFSPEEITAMILRKMKKIAEDHLGENVTDAVITIPAHFDSSQRQATKHAGIMAGLNVLEIISEPKAVAIAYRHYNKIVGERNLFVYDLGFETFDASVVTIRDDEIEVRSTTGDRYLGGRDFDNRLVEHFIVQIKKKHKIDISSNKRAVQRIRAKCEQVKWDLSTKTSAEVCLTSLFEEKDLHTTICRSRFEQLNEDLFEKMLTHVEECLRDAGMHRRNIDDIVFVSNSTRIPRIRSILELLFSKIDAKESFNSDEVVAYGAVVHARNIISKVAARRSVQYIANLSDSDCICFFISIAPSTSMNEGWSKDWILIGNTSIKSITIYSNKLREAFSN